MKGLMILMFLLSTLSVTSSFASVSTSSTSSSEAEEGQLVVADAHGAKCDGRIAGKTYSKDKKIEKVIPKAKKGAKQETEEQSA